MSLAERPDNAPEPQARRARARWALRDDEKLSSAAKLVWLMLDTRGDDPHPSLATLAANCRVTPKTAKRACRELEEAGWLRIIYRTARAGDSDTNRYELLNPHGYDHQGKPGSHASSGGVPAGHGGVGSSGPPPPRDQGKQGVPAGGGGVGSSETPGGGNGYRGVGSSGPPRGGHQDPPKYELEVQTEDPN